MKLLTLLLSVAILTSCGNQYRCYPSKKSRDYAETEIKEGVITKNHEKAILVSVNRTMKGYRHLFVDGQKDTIVKFFNCPLKVGECYYILKNFS